MPQRPTEPEKAREEEPRDDPQPQWVNGNPGMNTETEAQPTPEPSPEPQPQPTSEQAPTPSLSPEPIPTKSPVPTPIPEGPLNASAPPDQEQHGSPKDVDSELMEEAAEKQPLVEQTDTEGT